MWKKTVAQNIAPLIVKPFSFGNLWWALELLNFDLEALLFSAPQLLGHQIQEESKHIVSIHLFKLIGWSNPFHFLASFKSTTPTWIVILILLVCYTFLIKTLTAKPKEGKANIFTGLKFGEMKDPMSIFFSAFIFSYYSILLLVSWAVLGSLSCKSNYKLKYKYSYHDDGLPVLNDAFFDSSNSLEQIEENSWRLDNTKKCFETEHVLMSLIVIFILIMNGVFKWIHHIVVSYSPDSRIWESHKGIIPVLTSGIYHFLYILQMSALTTNSKSLTNLSFVAAVCVAVITLLSHLFLQPYLNPTTQNIRSIRCFVNLLLAMNSLLVRMNKGYREWLAINDAESLIIVFLFAPFFTKGLMIANSAIRTLPSLQIKIKEKSRILGNTIEFVMYNYHKMRQIPRKIRATEVYDIKWIQYVASQVHMSCLDDKEPSIVQRFGKLLQTILDQQWRIRISKMSELTPEILRNIQLWSSYSLDNFSEDAKVVSVLHQLNSIQNKAGIRSGKYSKESRKNCLFGLELLKSVSSLKIYLKSAKCQDAVENDERHSNEQTLGPSRLKMLWRVWNYLYKLKKLEDLIIKNQRNRIEALSGVLEGKDLKMLIKYSEKNLEYSKQIESILNYLNLKGSNLYFKVSAWNYFYSLYVKQDSIKVRQIVKNIVTHNIVNWIPDWQHEDYQTKNELVLAISAEHKEFHTIKYAAGNWTSIGMNVQLLVGNDMESILPNTFKGWHSKFVKERFTQYLEIRPEVHQYTYMKNGEEKIIRTSVDYQVSPSLTYGLEFMSKIYPQSLKEIDLKADYPTTEMVLLLDDCGNIKDMSINCEDYFVLNKNIKRHCSDIGRAIQLYKQSIGKISDRSSSDISFVPLISQPNQDDEALLSMFTSWIPVALKKKSSSTQIRCMVRLTHHGFSTQVGSGYYELILVQSDDDIMYNSISSKYAQTLRYSQELKDAYKTSHRYISVSISRTSGSNKKLHKNTSSRYSPKISLEEIPIFEPVLENRVSNFSEVPSPTTPNKKDSMIALNQSGNMSRQMTELFCVPPVEKLMSIYEKERENKRDIKLSKYLFYNHKLTSVRLLCCILLIPFTILAGVLMYGVIKETKVLANFEKVGVDMNLRDAEAYIIWVVFLHMQHADMRRMVAQKIVTDDQFDYFNMPSIDGRIMSFVNDSAYFDQLTIHSLRAFRLMSNSSYWEKYNADELFSSEIEAKIYDNQTGQFKNEMISPYKLVQLCMTTMRKKFTSNLSDWSVLSKQEDDPEEYVMRYNMMNPLTRFFQHEIENNQRVLKEGFDNMLSQWFISLFQNIGAYCLFLTLISMLSIYATVSTNKFATKLFDIPNELTRMEWIFKFLQKFESTESFDEIIDIGEHSINLEGAGKKSGRSSKKSKASSNSGSTGRGGSKFLLRSEKVNLQNKSSPINFWPVFITSVTMVTLLIAGCVIRYSVVISTAKEAIEYSLAASHFLSVYQGIVSINLALVETILWNGKATMNYMTSLDFYNFQRKFYETKALEPIEGIYTATSSASSILKNVLDLNICKVSRSFDPAPGAYSNCEEAMAGLTNNSMIDFIRRYGRLTDAFIIQWKSAQSVQARYDLLNENTFKSLIAYSFYNTLGTADNIYYTATAPTITIAKNSIGYVPLTLKIANIVSIPAFIAILILFSKLLIRQSIRIAKITRGIIYMVPIKCLERNAFVSFTIRQNRLLRPF